MFRFSSCTAALLGSLAFYDFTLFLSSFRLEGGDFLGMLSFVDKQLLEEFLVIDIRSMEAD